MKRSMWIGVLFGLIPLVGTAQEQRPGWAKPGVIYRIGLELDGELTGYVDSLVGGPAVGEVVTENGGATALTRKHIGNVKYEEISFKAGTGMTAKFYNWIDTGFNQTHNQAGKGRQNGALVFADYDYNELSRLAFTQAILTELGMPALDAASKDAAKMTIKFKPETSKYVAGGGKAQGVMGQKAKAWMVNNFEVHSVFGLEKLPVNKIEALVIKQKIVEAAVGETRDYEQEATSIEVPNLVITLAESQAKPLYDWHEDFVVKGNNSDDKEKGGTLEYLAADQKTVLFTLTFRNLGIFKVAPDKMEAGAEGVRRIKAEMYCEDIRFNYSPAATF